MSFLYMSFSASCIVLFIVILRGLFKRYLPIELFCGLWWLAMLRALVPFSIKSNYSIYNAKIALEGGVRQILNLTLSEREQTEWIISIGLIVCMVLIICISVFFARYFLKMHKYCNDIAENSALIQSLEMEEVFESIKFPVRKIRIKTSAVLDTPVSYGFLRPVIIMPKDLDINDKDTLKYILLHECIHIKYMHYLWKIVSVVVVCIHWFNPCMWLLYWYMDKDTEIFCDKKVVQILHEDKREMYARTLVNMALWQNESKILANNFIKKSMLKERIVMIMKFKKTSLVMTLASLFIFSSAATAFATTGVSVEMNDSNNDQIQVIEVSDEKICFVSDEVVTLDLSYEELEPYVNMNDAKRATKSIYIKDYKYTSKTSCPASLKVSMKQDGYTYTGTLTFSYGEKTANGTYVGYYCGYLYR